ncbi:MAG: transposase [Candidatus Omnitrophica bacterium]|nr:transposase [Candidatus Omnitrophota bacterium]
MSIGSRLLIEKACYHLIIRGNQQQAIFLLERDYQKFISSLRKYKKKYRFLLYGFCLMPNHVHLVGEPIEAKNLAKFMQCLNRSYTAYFNKHYTKVGHLWQGRFKSKVIVKDRYLFDCIQYVEFNPVRAKIVTTAADYRWSSYRERLLIAEAKGRLLNDINI